MSITNDSIERHSTVESTCETLWDLVLRICDEWFACEPGSMQWKAAYSERILDGTTTSAKAALFLPQCPVPGDSAISGL